MVWVGLTLISKYLKLNGFLSILPFYDSWDTTPTIICSGSWLPLIRLYADKYDVPIFITYALMSDLSIASVGFWLNFNWIL